MSTISGRVKTVTRKVKVKSEFHRGIKGPGGMDNISTYQKDYTEI